MAWVSALFWVCSLLFSYDIYRDVSCVYAYYAREIARGNFAEGWGACSNVANSYDWWDRLTQEITLLREELERKK